MVSPRTVIGSRRCIRIREYTAAGPTTFAYDANGNLTSETTAAVTRTYTYDIENRLVAASGGVQLGYDPIGRLAWTTGSPNFTRFLYDGDALVAEYDYAGSLVHRYVHGSNAGGDDPLVWYDSATVRWLHADHQGSIVAIANGSGAMSSINAYDEYGIPNGGNQGRFQYTGQAWMPELGMYHYKARIYSPTLGRFLQTDPVGYDDQLNLYAYVGNDPVNGTDPSGESAAVPCTGSRIGCGDTNGGICSTCSGFGGLSYPRTDLHIDRSRLLSGEQDRGWEGSERVQTACVGPLTFLRNVCGWVLSPILRRIATSQANRVARAHGLNIDRAARIGGGGRSGGNVGNLVGPPNSVVGKPGGNGLWFTNSRGQVVRDLTFTGDRQARVFQVVPGRGTVGPRLSPTREEWLIWRGF